MSVRLAGYAALFAIPDAAGDVIRQGAFARTLAGRDGPIPFYWQHRAHQPLGVVELAQEDARGLRIIARIENERCRAAADLLGRRVSGLSFGYRTVRAHPAPGGRVLEEIDLIEVSLVTRPLQPGARVHLVS